MNADTNQRQAEDQRRRVLGKQSRREEANPSDQHADRERRMSIATSIRDLADDQLTDGAAQLGNC
jgi:hypothetical protein